MAATGAALYLFVTVHLLGNLQVFLGPDAINHYAAALKSVPEILWGARLGLLACVGLHILTTVQLARINNKARPTAYAKKANSASTAASRTMYATNCASTCSRVSAWSGAAAPKNSRSHESSHHGLWYASRPTITPSNP